MEIECVFCFTFLSRIFIITFYVENVSYFLLISFMRFIKIEICNTFIFRCVKENECQWYVFSLMLSVNVWIISVPGSMHKYQLKTSHVEKERNQNECQLNWYFLTWRAVHWHYAIWCNDVCDHEWSQNISLYYYCRWKSTVQNSYQNHQLINSMLILWLKTIKRVHYICILLF